MKRSLFSSCCVGLIVAGAMIAVPLTSVHADQTKDAKDAAKDALNKGKDAAKDALKKGTDAAKDAAHGATQGAGMDPKMAEAMKNMQAQGALNENHGYLKQLEGEWDCATKMWMAEGAPPQEDKFTSSAKVSFDGHFLIEKLQGNMNFGEGVPPMPFTGMSIIGYDNFKKQFTSTWLDNMTSGIMNQTGSASQGGKVFTFEGEGYCCMNNKICDFKSVCTIIDANTRKFEMWGPDDSGKMFKGMEITYTRKK